MPSVLDESTPTRDNATAHPTPIGAAKTDRPVPNKSHPSVEAGAAPRVLDPDGKPWTSTNSTRMKTATKVLPYALAGIAGIAAMGTGYVVMARRRERERSLRGRVMTLLGSAIARQIATGLGGIAVGAATSMAKSAIAQRRSAK